MIFKQYVVFGCALALRLGAGVEAAAEPLGTAFTYQGQLKQDGVPANGPTDFVFQLFNAETDGAQVGASVVRDGVLVVNGLFTVELDFGTSAFTGEARWLEVSVNGAPLTARHPITPVPYALRTHGVDGHSLDGADDGPIDALFVDSAGNVGIGTTTPTHQLEVVAPAGDVFQASGPTGLITYGAWVRATAAAAWSARFGHTSVVHGGTMWVIGGVDAGGNKSNDVWSSADGVIWTRATPAAAWAVRDAHTSVVHDAKIWVIGGRGATGNSLGDVWSSENGINWTPQTAFAPWPARNQHASVVHDGSIWVLGGAGLGGAELNDVWSSPDGVNWTEATPAAPWAARFGHAAVVHDGRIWVLGGRLAGNVLKNDVWSSADGVTWEEETPAAPWTVRWYHASVVHHDKIWVVGGDPGTVFSALGNDVWYSPDGVNWTQQTAAAAWPVRIGHASVAHDGRVWVVGGSGGGVLNDAWSLSGAPFVGAVLKLTAEGRVGINTALPSHPLHVGTDGTNGNGAHVTTGGVWTNGSDRASKKNFEPIDTRAILAKLVDLPVTKWQYQGEDDSIYHIGPVAQDFYEAFGLGGSEAHIGTLDADGVTLAAIQALSAGLEQKNAEIARLRARLDAIEAVLAKPPASPDRR